MSQDTLAYIFSFSSVFTFSIAAIGFTYFSQKVSPLWMNFYKCLVSFLISLPIIFYLNNKFIWSFSESWPFYLSGIIGLNIGDLFLLSAYKKIGPARTLMFFCLQPLLAGTFSFIIWQETIYPIQLIAIFFFIACLILFSYERFKILRQWEFSGFIFAIMGVLLDTVGVIITRYGFNQNPGFTGFDVQYMRAFAALSSFIIFLPFEKIYFFKFIKKLSYKEITIATVSSIFGTFLSLILYLQAIKLGKLIAVTSIVLTDPMMSTFFESIWLKTWPSKYLWMGLICFFCAIFFLLYPKFFY